MLWNRQIELIGGGKAFHSDNIEIDFSIPFDDDTEPDIGEITIYNLSDDSINSITNDKNIILNAGYKGDVGTIFQGTIQKCQTAWDGVDKKTVLTVGEASKQWLEYYVSKTYEQELTAKAIINDLAAMFGMEIGRIELVNDIVYTKGRNVSGMLQTVIKQIVQETGSSFKIAGGKIHIYPHGQGVETGYLLNADTGLIESPEPFEKTEDKATISGFNIKMCLCHKIGFNSIIQVESKTANGIYRVKSGSHSGGDFITTVEVVEQ